MRWDGHWRFLASPAHTWSSATAVAAWIDPFARDPAQNPPPRHTFLFAASRSSVAPPPELSPTRLRSGSDKNPATVVSSPLPSPADSTPDTALPYRSGSPPAGLPPSHRHNESPIPPAPAAAAMDRGPCSNIDSNTAVPARRLS